ncbi:hypothetical protein SAMN06264364_119111 [Quadrisphaera granulorum]|uniref:Uncharacterized protein n=1 Tax=Quadrisphaera granulorum TaxID=317664 RepID=A0A316A3R3_9ACTN|nr:hypothetical protein [Quadrisphaera granulorum]PWJ52616.1 hypothetical protein BXY45_119111 [Quadrisphaera granulorum]SZE97666.1 hypothetical protein SAMN06264364_119111 [Quadrisphaera granulorum]
MLRDPITVLVEDTVAAHPDTCADCLGRLLHGRRQYLPASPPTRWKAGDVRAVLLDMAPARITDPCDLPAHAAPALEALLDLLESTGRLHPGSAKPATLRRELNQAAPLAPDALADRRRWRLAKTLYAQMLAEGVDIADDDACEAWAEEFSERDDDARAVVLKHLAASDPSVLRARFIARNGQAAALDPDDPRNIGLTASAVIGGPSATDDEPTEPYPTVPLPSRAEAADAARQSPMLATLVSVSQFLVGRKTTKDGEPVPADVELLSLMTGEAEHGERLRHLRDAPLTAELLRTAELVELIAPGMTGWLPGHRLPPLRDDAIEPNLADLSDDEVLELWQATFTVTERMVAARDSGSDETTWRSNLMPEVTVTLYRCAGGQGTPVAIDTLARAAALTSAPPAPPTVPGGGDLADMAAQMHELMIEARTVMVLEQVAVLEFLGALVLDDDAAADVPTHRAIDLHRSERRASLTPLGLWAVHAQLQRAVT